MARWTKDGLRVPLHRRSTWLRDGSMCCALMLILLLSCVRGDPADGLTLRLLANISLPDLDLKTNDSSNIVPLSTQRSGDMYVTWLSDWLSDYPRFTMLAINVTDRSIAYLKPYRVSPESSRSIGGGWIYYGHGHYVGGVVTVAFVSPEGVTTLAAGTAKAQLSAFGLNGKAGYYQVSSNNELGGYNTRTGEILKPRHWWHRVNTGGWYNTFPYTRSNAGRNFAIFTENEGRKMTVFDLDTETGVITFEHLPPYTNKRHQKAMYARYEGSTADGYFFVSLGYNIVIDNLSQFQTFYTLVYSNARKQLLANISNTDTGFPGKDQLVDTTIMLPKVTQEEEEGYLTISAVTCHRVHSNLFKKRLVGVRVPLLSTQARLSDGVQSRRAAFTNHTELATYASEITANPANGSQLNVFNWRSFDDGNVTTYSLKNGAQVGKMPVNLGKGGGICGHQRCYMQVRPLGQSSRGSGAGLLLLGTSNQGSSAGNSTLQVLKAKSQETLWSRHFDNTNWNIHSAISFPDLGVLALVENVQYVNLYAF